jgi:hypothetical protein
MHSDKKRSKRKGSKDDTPNRLALPKVNKALLRDPDQLEAECDIAMRRVLGLAESEPETGARSRRAPRENPDGTLNAPRSRPSSRASDRNLSGSPKIINIEGPDEPQSPKVGLTVDDVQRQAGAQTSPEIPPPNLDGFGATPDRKTLSEWMREEFARFNGEMTEITGRLTKKDAKVAETVTRLDGHKEQIKRLNTEVPTIRQTVTGLRSSIAAETTARIAAIEANIAATMLTQRNATEALQTRMVAHIERAVGQLQNSLNELRQTGITEFDDTELRVDLRRLVEAQGEEITNGLAQSLGQHSEEVGQAIVELKVRMSRLDTRLRTIYRAQQPPAQSQQPEGRRSRQGAQSQQPETGRTRQQRKH